ncbi:MAG: hypothetical protein HQL47_03680 [Gammaproteobacteria bacterium]|nr:hypothetical protein [Gammaproteobacteria bacterium]
MAGLPMLEDEGDAEDMRALMALRKEQTGGLSLDQRLAQATGRDITRQTKPTAGAEPRVKATLPSEYLDPQYLVDNPYLDVDAPPGKKLADLTTARWGKALQPEAKSQPALASKATGSVDPREFYQYVTSKGVPHAHALGMMANIEHESGWDAGINEQQPVVPGSRGGYGLFQHTGPRRTGLEGYAAKQGTPVSDWRVQVDYALSEPDTKSYLAQNFGDGTEAGNWFLNNWERPKAEHRPARMKAMPTKVSHYGGLVSGEMPEITAPTPAQGLARAPARAKDLGPQVAENYQPSNPLSKATGMDLDYGFGKRWLDGKLGGLQQPKSTPIKTQGFNDQAGPIPAAQRPTQTASAKNPRGYRAPSGGSAMGGLVAGLLSSMMDDGGGASVPDMPMDTNDYHGNATKMSEYYSSNLGDLIQQRWQSAMTPQPQPYQDEEYT